MSIIDQRAAPPGAKPTDETKDIAVPSAAPWGNSAPLALAAFALTTFLLSMINAGFVDKGIEPVVFGMALTFGGLTQLIAGLFQFRTGNTFAGVLFSSFGAFWLSFWAIVTFFLADVPKDQVGHAIGLYLIAWGIFSTWMWAASFRTSIVVNAALAVLAATFFFLGAGNYSDTSGLVTTGGYLGLVVAAMAAYLSFAEVCEASYHREVVPVGHLAKH